MDLTDFVSGYKRFLIRHADLVRAKKEKSYLYSDLIHYGLSFRLREKYLKTYSTVLKPLSKSETLALVNLLWTQPSFEEKMLALDILVMHARSLTGSDMPLVERLMRQSKCWALLDNFIIQIMPYLLTQDKRVYAHLNKWLRENDYWIRRSALLSQLLFFRSGQGGDKKLFLAMAVSQFDESWIDLRYRDKLENKRAKFFIRKAIGWTLREMSQKDPQIVIDFLSQYKGKMSGLTFREASRKLPKRYHFT